VCGVEDGRAFIVGGGGRRAERHEHDADDRSVTAAVLEANLSSVLLDASRQHRMPLATLSDHVRQELLYSHAPVVVTLRTSDPS